VGNLLFSCSLNVSISVVFFSSVGIEKLFIFFNLNCMFYDGRLLCNSILSKVLSGVFHSFYVSVLLLCKIY
jgi:hypothetical protein